MKKIIVICSIIWCVILGICVTVLIQKHTNFEANYVEADTMYSENLYYKIPDSELIEINPETGGKYVKNELIFETADDISFEEVNMLVEQYGGSIIGYIGVTKTYQVSLAQDITYDDLCNIRQRLSENPEISHISLNLVMPCSECTGVAYPNDKKWKNEWNTNPEGENWGLEAIQAPEAWNLLKDNDNYARIGVFEVNGVDVEHEDLKNNIEDIIGYQYGDLSHGTEVAGIIGAEYNNRIGITGVVPNVRMSIASFGRIKEHMSEREENEENSSILMAYKVGLVYLVATQECKVINFSLGHQESMFAASRGNEEAVKDTQDCNNELSVFLKILLDQGYDFLICKGAGNLNNAGTKFIKADEGDSNAIFGYIKVCDENSDILKDYKKRDNYESMIDYGNCDAQYDFFSGITDPEVKNRIIVVGSCIQTENGYKVADHSCCGERVDLVAPGTNIMSLEPNDHYTSNSWGSSYLTGTSFAAPFVSGVAGLVYMVNPNLTGKEVKEILKSSTLNECVGYLNEKEYKYQMVNAQEAVKKAQKTLEDKNQGEQESEQKAIELTQYLGMDISDVICNFEGMEDNHVTSGGAGYTNGTITFEARQANVTFIQIHGESASTIKGVGNGMKKDEAIQTLTDQGWTIEQSTEQYYLLSLDNGNQISLYCENKSTVDMISYFESEKTISKAPVETSTVDIFQMLVDHYAISDPEATVMEGWEESGIYMTDVRTGVLGNPAASQRLYDVQVDISTGIVTEWNVIFNETTTWLLY